MTRKSHIDRTIEQLQAELHHLHNTEIQPRQIAIEKLRAQAVKAKASRVPRRKMQLAGSAVEKSAS